ncbi:MAG: tRNA 2-thiocytidine(32) synthetase TtcA [Lachnospiraceae bacterium]|nr:tRNA 2-thiocytidine(32) synthetase TtcA [Lachnospiraceae bacterium]
MDKQKLFSLTRQAIERYNMIEEGDRIAIGLSGGKDSLTLLTVLSGLQKFYPKKFELMGITCDVGFEGMDFHPVSSLCNKLGIPYTIVHTQIKEIVFNHHQGQRPCSLCAKLRKGAIYAELQNQNFNKIAYAHNKDDFLETAFMSLIYEGRFYAFPPVTHLEGSGITVIRPLMLVPEKSVEGFVKKEGLPVVKNTCPVDGTTKRAYAKDLVERINRENPGAKDRIMHAIQNANLPDWI